MAKNSYKANVNQYANQEEAIRKAKGNPNRISIPRRRTATTAGTPPARTWPRRWPRR